MCPVVSDSRTTWWVVPHPLQTIGLVKCLNWHLLGAADFFESAARAPPGAVASRTQQVHSVTRTGVLLLRLGVDHGGKPCMAYNCFWAALESPRDYAWQNWLFGGFFDKLDPVMDTLGAAGFARMQCGVFIYPGEPAYCGSFIDDGRVVPLHCPCEQAGGAYHMQLLRYHLYCMACSEGHILWTPVLSAGDWPPAPATCSFERGTGGLVPMLFNSRVAQ